MFEHDGSSFAIILKEVVVAKLNAQSSMQAEGIKCADLLEQNDQSK